MHASMVAPLARLTTKFMAGYKKALDHLHVPARHRVNRDVATWSAPPIYTLKVNVGLSTEVQGAFSLGLVI